MKDKKNLILTIILSVVAVIILVGAVIILNSSYAPKENGEIKIQLVDVENEVLTEKTIEFYEGESLQYLIEKNFENVVFENGMIMSFESFTTPSDWSMFLMIYVNGAESYVGLADIKFTDGTIITFKITEYISS